MRHDRLAIISGANPIPHGAACACELGQGACRHVRARRLMWFGRRLDQDAPGIDTLHGRMQRLEKTAAVRCKKPATSFPARARLLR
jgi:hypothetical protein